MLIFGKSCSDWKAKAAYAVEKAANEFAEVREVRCEGIEEVLPAFEVMAAFAASSKCIKFLYHATINLTPGERLTKEQWMQAVDRLEKDLKLTGHYRVVFEHIKNDRQHYHIVWSRIPPNGNAPAVTMGNDFYVHQNTAKALEKQFGLKPAPRRDKSKPSHKKQEINNRNAQIRVKPEIVAKEVTQIFKASQTTPAFIANLTGAGYVLTRAKNDSLVLVDRQGGYHGLMRRIAGHQIADLRKKFPELEKLPLPSLNSVLGARHPASAQSFKRVGKTVTRQKIFVPRPMPVRGVFYRPRLLQAISRSIRVERKYYPLPFMRRRKWKQGDGEEYFPMPVKPRRKRKVDLNEPVVLPPNQTEIENAELLEWAWEQHRPDILAQFGIILPPGYEF